MSWLKTHNPAIDWRRRTITFNSLLCEDCGITDSETIEAIPEENQVNPTINVVEIPRCYQEFSDVFSPVEAKELPPHRPYNCEIELIPDMPIPHGKIYSLSPHEQEVLKAYLDEALELGFIRPSKSPARAPIFFVEKKGGELRPCVDYAELNDITVKNRYPLPLIPDLIDQVKEATIFSKLDLRGAYNLVRMREGDEWKTAFKTKYGHFEYLVMPFGLCNAPAAFQYFVNDIFRDIIGHFVAIYLDDFLVYSDNEPEHVEHVREVLKRLRHHHLYVKLEKCQFHATRVEYLGHVLSPGKIEMDQAKISAVLDWPTPQNVKDIQRFLGFANYYRRFIPNFSALVRPMTALTKKNVKFEWTGVQEESMDTLKRLFCTSPILLQPDPTKPFHLEADASCQAIGAVLSQRDATGVFHPVAFFSKKMLPAEQNYTILEKELLAIKEALSHWRHYLEGAKFPIDVITDHRNLVYLQNIRCQNARHACWSLFFSRFHLQISYRPGICNSKADALSHLDPREPRDVNKEPLPIFHPNQFLEEQLLSLQDCADWVPEVDEAEKEELSHAGVELTLDDKGRWTYGGKLYIPSKNREKVLRWIHDEPQAGHPGIDKTRELCGRMFWWPNWSKEVEDQVRGCDVCAQAKRALGKMVVRLQPLETASTPWDMIAMDFISDLPRCCGKSVIWVVVDLFSKMAHFVALNKLPSAPELLELFLAHVYRNHSLPSKIVSDRGPQFTANLWKEILSQWGIQSALSTAYHPQTDGQTERTNQTLEQYLRCYAVENKNNWTKLLPLVEFAFNNAYHSAIKMSPFECVYGTTPRMIPSILPESKVAMKVPAAQQTMSRLERIHALAKKNLEEAKKEYERHSVTKCGPR